MRNSNVVYLGSGNEAAYKPRFNILNREELLKIPEPDYLIEGLFLQESLAQIFGEPDAWKTFLAFGAACSVATGKPFLGTYEPKSIGDAVYIYGEGGRVAVSASWKKGLRSQGHAARDA